MTAAGITEPRWLAEVYAAAPVDILAIGPHPDDVELGAGGTLAVHARRGLRVAILDLSRGELASNGTPAGRLEEAARAAAILGVAARYNLGLPDGGLGPEPGQVGALARALRAFRPRLVLMPFAPDRNPDHGGAALLIERALFAAGLRRYEAELPPHRVELAAAYFINDSAPPAFVVDVTDVYEVKRRAIAAHASQFDPAGSPTVINRPSFLAAIEARDRYFGSLVGTGYAEGFVLRNRPPRVASLLDLLPAGDGAG